MCPSEMIIVNMAQIQLMVTKGEGESMKREPCMLQSCFPSPSLILIKPFSPTSRFLDTEGTLITGAIKQGTELFLVPS